MAENQSTKDSDLSDAELNARLNFKRAFDHTTMERIERSAIKVGQARRVTLAVLTRDVEQLSNVSLKEGDTYDSMVKAVNDYQSFVKGMLELTDAAEARLIIADAREIPADPA